MSTKTRYIPVSEWDQFYPWPTVGALRVRICEAEKRGGDQSFLDCVVRVGHRVLIDEAAFTSWMRAHVASSSDRERLAP